MSTLRRIFYVSRANPGVDDAVVRSIVLRSQRTNRQLDITGVLAHSGPHFAQILEGAEENLAALTDKIAKDERHAEVKILFDHPISTREHGEWSMGFLYDVKLSDELEKALTVSMSQAQASQLARAIFVHVTDLARP